ncbi:uncharacterized protein ACIB01_005397 [Guaruba guarouba]
MATFPFCFLSLERLSGIHSRKLELHLSPRLNVHPRFSRISSDYGSFRLRFGRVMRDVPLEVSLWHQDSGSPAVVRMLYSFRSHKVVLKQQGKSTGTSTSFSKLVPRHKELRDLCKFNSKHSLYSVQILLVPGKRIWSGKCSSCLHAAHSTATALLLCLKASPVKIGSQKPQQKLQPERKVKCEMKAGRERIAWALFFQHFLIFNYMESLRCQLSKRKYAESDGNAKYWP